MAFKTEVEDVLRHTTQTIRENDRFELSSREMAVELASDIQKAMDLEDPENDSAIHNAVAEEINIFLSQLEPVAVAPSSLPAFFFLVTQVTELLRERNEQIYFSDIMGGTHV